MVIIYGPDSNLDTGAVGKGGRGGCDERGVGVDIVLQENLGKAPMCDVRLPRQNLFTHRPPGGIIFGHHINSSRLSSNNNH